MLSAFIRGQHDEIIREFAIFAETQMPAGAVMTEVDLRDHAEEVLTAVVEDMASAQSLDEQIAKSRGRGRVRAMAASGRLHADHRIRQGFSLEAVLAEFRALRATVLRLYELSGQVDLGEVRRFNESVDEVMTESMQRFAAQTNLFRDQFIGVLGHDLRTPLGAITTGAALLAVPEDNPQRRARVAARILSSAQRMERMIADLLDLARARLGGRIPLTRRPADLQQVCEEVVIEIRAGHPSAVLRLDASGDLGGDWDADRLAQVVSNLVSNAIQHGGGTPILLDARDEGDLVTLSVHNGGSPIPAEVMPFIFEPLAQGRSDDANSTQNKNIGLGLFIARAVVAAHGGEIKASSSSDAGTTFKVSLPRGHSRPEVHG